jgi:hypothetical protein
MRRLTLRSRAGCLSANFKATKPLSGTLSGGLVYYIVDSTEVKMEISVSVWIWLSISTVAFLTGVIAWFLGMPKNK